MSLLTRHGASCLTCILHLGLYGEIYIDTATGEHIDPTTVQRTGPENAGEARHGE